MKKIYTMIIALSAGLMMHTNAQTVTVHFQVDMTGAMLGADAGACTASAFVPGTDVVEPMGQEYNNWTATETVDCGATFTPNADDMTQISSGSSIYVIAKDVTPTGDSIQFKYRIDHAWGNDELRGVGDGNRHAHLPVGATEVLISSIFNDPAMDITESNGVKNIKFARINAIYPNPSKEVAFVNYVILNSDVVKVYITNAVGQVVKQVVNEKQSFGSQLIPVSLTDLTSGIYFVNVSVGNSVATQKLSVVN